MQTYHIYLFVFILSNPSYDVYILESIVPIILHKSKNPNTNNSNPSSPIFYQLQMDRPIFSPPAFYYPSQFQSQIDCNPFETLQ